MKAKHFATAVFLAAMTAASPIVQHRKCEAADTQAADSSAAPQIKFLRPMTNEMFSNAPFYIQVTVDNFKLLAPGQRDGAPAAGYIRYTLDDYPAICTKSTQIMVNKNLGRGYIPTGKHYLRAELVDCEDRPLSPAVVADAQFWSMHPAYIEESRAGVGSSPTANDELENVQRELDKVQQRLIKLERGDTGYEPKPMPPWPNTKRPTVPKAHAVPEVAQ